MGANENDSGDAVWLCRHVVCYGLCVPLTIIHAITMCLHLVWPGNVLSSPPTTTMNILLHFWADAPPSIVCLPDTWPSIPPTRHHSILLPCPVHSSSTTTLGLPYPYTQAATTNIPSLVSCHTCICSIYVLFPWMGDCLGATAGWCGSATSCDMGLVKDVASLAKKNTRSSPNVPGITSGFLRRGAISGGVSVCSWRRRNENNMRRAGIYVRRIDIIYREGISIV